MMHLSSFFSLSSLFFFLYFCRPAAATATLAVSLVKRVRPYDSIECPGPLPHFIPDDFPRFSFLLKTCANRAGYPPKLECILIENQLICCTSSSYYLRMYVLTYLSGLSRIDWLNRLAQINQSLLQPLSVRIQHKDREGPNHKAIKLRTQRVGQVSRPGVFNARCRRLF